jgi:hypothetical protein
MTSNMNIFGNIDIFYWMDIMPFLNNYFFAQQATLEGPLVYMD